MIKTKKPHNILLLMLTIAILINRVEASSHDIGQTMPDDCTVGSVDAIASAPIEDPLSLLNMIVDPEFTITDAHLAQTSAVIADILAQEDRAVKYGDESKSHAIAGKILILINRDETQGIDIAAKILYKDNVLIQSGQIFHWIATNKDDDWEVCNKIHKRMHELDRMLLHPYNCNSEFLQTPQQWNIATVAHYRHAIVNDIKLMHIQPRSVGNYIKALIGFKKKNLILERKNLSKVPPYLDQLTSLQKLALKYNVIDSFNARMFPPSLATLDLRHNKIIKIQAGMIPLNIRILGLANNEITHIPVNAFNRLINLQTLDLSHNAITMIPTCAFPPRLQKLYLSHNHIWQIRANAFPPSLQILQLSHNILWDIPDGAFTGLTRLRRLIISVGLKILPTSIIMLPSLQHFQWAPTYPHHTSISAPHLFQLTYDQLHTDTLESKVLANKRLVLRSMKIYIQAFDIRSGSDLYAQLQASLLPAATGLITRAPSPPSRHERLAFRRHQDQSSGDGAITKAVSEQ